jgi:hypothetical protein
MRTRCQDLLLAVLVTAVSFSLSSAVVRAAGLQGSLGNVPISQFANCQIGWDQDADSLATAQTGPYTATWDTGAAHVVAATCTGTASPFQCQAAAKDIAGTDKPSLGNHSFTLSTAAGVSVAQSMNVTGLGIPKNFRLILAGLLSLVVTWILVAKAHG